MPAKYEDINELLESAYESDSQEEIKVITKKILEHNPNHPEALLLLADTLEDEEEQLTLLNRAYKIAKNEFYAEFGAGEEEEALDSDSGIVYAGIIQRMIIPLSDSGKIEEAFKLAQDLRTLDPENQVQSHSLYYYMLLKKKDFSRVLEETMKDSIRSLAWAWSRFIAVYMLSGECSSSEKNFWEAIQMGPDVPFYMFGNFEEPNGNTEEDEEDFSFSLLFSEHVACNSEDLAAYVLSKANFFGLLSNRITDKDIDDYDVAMEILRNSGLMDNYLKLLDELDGKSYPDESIIKMISRNFSC
jgi:tetratricopeptide (TPR) repeat protein